MISGVLLCSTLWMPPKYEVRALQLHSLKALKHQQENLRNGRFATRDRAVATFDLDAGMYASMSRAAARIKWNTYRRRCAVTGISPKRALFTADLSGVFNWNVKQLFVYMTATFETKTNVSCLAFSEFHSALSAVRASASAPALHLSLHPCFLYKPFRPPLLQSVNELVVWDRIITSPAEAVLQERDAWFKYPVVDQRTELRGRLLNLTLHWDVMPYSGLLYTGSGGRFVARLPASYCVEGVHAGSSGSDACDFDSVESAPGSSAA